MSRKARIRGVERTTKEEGAVKSWSLDGDEEGGCVEAMAQKGHAMVVWTRREQRVVVIAFRCSW
jgi:hypothetical protein